MNEIVDVPKKIRETSLFAKAIAFYFLIAICDTFTIGDGTPLKMYAFILVGVFFTQCYKISLIPSKVLLFELVYVLICALSIVYSINSDASLTTFISIAMNIGLITICSLIPFSKKEVDLFRKSMVWGGLIIFIIALFFADFSYGGRFTISILGEGADENTLNGYLLYAFSYFVYEFIAGKRRGLSLIVSMMCMIFVFLTGSRGALIAFLIVILVAMIIGFKNGGKQKQGAYIVLFSLIGFLVFYESIISLLPSSLAERYSLEYIMLNGTTGRSDIWEALLGRFWKDNIGVVLFGNGIGTSQFYNVFNNLVAHNLFIEILVGVGIVGLSIFLILLYLIFEKAWKSKQTTEFIALCGFMTLSMTLSLVAYKPIFNLFFLIEVSSNVQKRQNKESLDILDECKIQ